MKTANDFGALIGKAAIYNINSLKFPVSIVNVRSAFGRIDYQIQPVDNNYLSPEDKNKNVKWVDANSVKLY